MRFISVNCKGLMSSCMTKGRKENQIGAVVNPQDSSLSSFNVQWSGDGEVSLSSQQTEPHEGMSQVTFRSISSTVEKRELLLIRRVFTVIRFLHSFCSDKILQLIPAM